MTHTRLNKAEWLALGEQLFGADIMLWRFVCPSCGHVQKPEDFRIYADEGASPDTARFNCIGRYDGHGDVPLGTKPGPCNYTSGGLICLAPLTVTDEAGREYRVFDFERTAEMEPTP